MTHQRQKCRVRVQSAERPEQTFEPGKKVNITRRGTRVSIPYHVIEYTTEVFFVGKHLERLSNACGFVFRGVLH